MKLTDKPILSTLFILSWPIMIGEGMQLMYNLADTFWVGQLGSNELAAISLSFPLIFVMFSVGAGFSVAGMTLVSQHTGAEQEKDANLVAGQILVFSVIVSILFSGLGLILGRDLLKLMGAEPEVLQPAWEYFRIILMGAPLMFIYFIFSSVLQGVGDTKTPMKIKIITVIANIILDPFLIFGWSFFPALGMAGAAIATIASRLIATVIALTILFTKSKGIQLTLSDLKPDKEVIWQIIKIGSPAAVGMSALSIAMTVMTYIVTAFGTFALAAWGVVSRLTSLIRLPSQGLSRSTGVLVGQHLGADQPNKAEESAWTGVAVVFIVMTSLAFLNLVFAPYIVRPFTSKPEVLQIAVKYFRIAGFAYTFLGIQMVVSGALKGAGKTFAQMFFRVLTLWILQIPLSYFLAHNAGWGVDGIWWGIFFSKLFGCLFLLLWFKKGTWKNKIVKTVPAFSK
ncbi:MAG: MATE family efflux transporter [Patescibacteria group bacterium]